MRSRGRFWDHVLIGVICLVGLYSVGLVVVGLVLGDEVFDRMGFGPRDGAITSPESRRYVRLVYGVLGAVLIGWMLTLWGLARGPLKRREPWAWWTVTGAVSVWFVLDTGLSFAFGFVGHATFNLVFAVALAVPLLVMRTQIQPRGAR